MVYDAIIVGAGLTGLKAAYDLTRAGKSVLVLEARSRIGGRAYSVQETYNGAPTTFDFGAHFIGDENYQKPIWDLVKTLGLKTFAQYEGPGANPQAGGPFWAGQGANLQENDKGTFDAYIGTTVPENENDQYYLLMMQELVDGIPLEAPWTAPTAAGFDTLSVQDWVTTVNIPQIGPPSSYFQKLVRMLCRVGFSTEPENISMLWLLFYIRSSGGLQRFQAIRWPMQGAQGYRLEKGAQSIAEALADTLVTPVQTNVQVAHIDCPPQSNVTITDTNGQTYVGKSVLIAMAPALYKKLSFTPALPAGRMAAANAMGNSTMIMAYVQFDTAFWRTDTTQFQMGAVNGIPVYPNNPDPAFAANISEYGLSGDVLMLDGPSVWMMDNTSAEGAPALFAFLVGDEAKKVQHMTPAQRGKMIITRMTSIFGSAVQANNPVYHEKDWNADPFSEGCPAGHFGKGGFFSGGAEILLNGKGREPLNSVFFASTETATLSNGYMSGAVWSGTEIARIMQGYIQQGPATMSDDFSRGQTMEYVAKTMTTALQMQNPMVEAAVITPNSVLHGPGGKLLSGSFSGIGGRIDFYTMLGLYFTITKVEQVGIDLDLSKNKALIQWRLSGVANAAQRPFSDLPLTAEVIFSPPGVLPVQAAEVQLVTDTLLLDSLGQGHPFNEANMEAIAKLASVPDLSWMSRYNWPDGMQVWGPGEPLPKGPFAGLSGLRTILGSIANFPYFVLTDPNVYTDFADLTVVATYQLSAQYGSKQTSAQPFVIIFKFANGAGNEPSDILFQSDMTVF